MTPSRAVFQALALCTQRPGHGLVEGRLAEAFRALPPGALADAAEHHGLEPLVAAHFRSAGLAADPDVLDRLRARCLQHAHAGAVRARVISEVLVAMDRSRVRLLLLKGAAFAQLAYAGPHLRPMRDVDLLIHADDLRQAHDVLVRCGFATTGRLSSQKHHHLPGLSRTVDGATVTIELHHELLPRTPFLAPIRYEDVASESQAVESGGVAARAPGREDLLWHAYAHGFAINTLSPGLRLISLADVVHGVETWVDLLDWDRLRRRYPRLVRALALVSCLVPWSPRAAAHVGECAVPARWTVRPIADSSFAWSSALRADVLWPDEWWFRMRYGVRGLPAWVWYRSVGHPAAFMASAGRTLAARWSGQR